MRYSYDFRAMRRAVERAGGPKEVARLAGVSRGAVYYWIAGPGVPTARLLAKLATALGMAPGDFFRAGK